MNVLMYSHNFLQPELSEDGVSESVCLHGSTVLLLIEIMILISEYAVTLRPRPGVPVLPVRYSNLTAKFSSSLRMNFKFKLFVYVHSFRQLSVPPAACQGHGVLSYLWYHLMISLGL